MGEEKCRVAREGLVKKLHRFKEIISQARGVNVAVVNAFFCSQEEIVGSEVRGGTLADRTLFLWRELSLKLVGYFLGDLALNRENIGEIAIIGLRPKMRISAGVNELRHYPNAVRRALNASFQDMGYAKLPSDFLQVARRPILVLHHALRELPAPSGSLKKECGGNRAARCSESQSGASVHDDSRDRLVDFMCHGGGHFAEQSEAVEPACCRRTFAFGDEKPERRAGVPSFRIESLDVSLGRGGVEMSLKK